MVQSRFGYFPVYTAALIAASMALTGCIPHASVLTSSVDVAKENPPKGTYSEIKGDEVYRVFEFYEIESLNFRLRHNVGAVRITLLNGEELIASDARVTRDSIIYFLDNDEYLAESIQRSVAIDKAKRLTIRDRVDAQDAFRAAGVGAAAFAGLSLVPQVNRESVGEAFKSFGVGALIGIPVGIFIEYYDQGDRHTVLLNGYGVGFD